MLFGPRGSGKTALLNELATRCRRQAAQPFVPVLDLERFDAEQRGWEVIGHLAYELSATDWVQFGRLRFPRFALGRMIVEGQIVEKSPESTQSAIEDLLRQSLKLDERARSVATLVGQLPQLLGLPAWVSATGYVGAWAIRGRPIVRLLFRTGMEFYGDALRRPRSGFPALVELGRLGQDSRPASQTIVDRLLCQAFLADLVENYSHGFRPRNSLVLLDNAHAPAGRALLIALAAANSAPTSRGAPLVAVATSRRIDALAPLLATSGAHVDHLTLWARMTPDTSAKLSGQTGGQSAPKDSGVYSIRLSDLSLEDVELIEGQGLGGQSFGLTPFVHSLTRGHPWSVIKAFEAVTAFGRSVQDLTPDDLRHILDVHCPKDAMPLGEVAANYLLLNDLPQVLRTSAITWSAAADVVLAEEVLPATAGLQAYVAPLCWLISGDDSATPDLDAPARLHTWMRHLLLRKLSLRSEDGTDWDSVYEVLRRHCRQRPIDAPYYELAVGRLSGAIGYLNTEFEKLDADEWIARFNRITSAPHQHGRLSSASAEHGDVMKGLLACMPEPDDLPTSDPHGERWLTIAGMTVARWIWSDSLRDPTLEIAPIVENGYRDLARRMPRGQLRLVAEAQFYSYGGRP